MQASLQPPAGMFVRPARKRFAGLRLSALTEIAIALAFLLVLDMLALDGTRYWASNPHPFWFIVLFVACKYGTKEGLIAAIACSVALLFGNMPPQSIEQDGYAYAMYVLKLPLLWLVSAVAFGELRQMHIRERNKLEESLLESQEHEQRIAQSYQWVKELKDQLELRMAGQLRSSIATYRAAKTMESLSPEEVLKGLEDLVGNSLHPEQFSVYFLNNGALDITMLHGWKDSDSYIRHFGTASHIYQAIIARQEVLCVANAEHERVLGGQGILAGPLVDKESGEVVGMLKIEKMGFTDLHLSNIETFGTICEWAGMAIVNARKYQAVKADSVVNPEHNLLTSNYFKRYTEYMKSLAERVGFEVSMISVRLSNPQQFDDATRLRIARALSESVDSVLRDIDLAFDHQEHNDDYSIVLPATGRKGAQVVVEKIRKALESGVSRISRSTAKNADFAFTVQTLYEKRAA